MPTWNLADGIKKVGTWAMPLQALYIISNPSIDSNWSYSPETLNVGHNWRFLVLCELEFRQKTLKDNGAPLLFYFKLCASFQSHQWIQTGVAVRKPQNWGTKFVLTSVTLNCANRRTEIQTYRRTDRQTDRSVLGAAWSELKYICIVSSILTFRFWPRWWQPWRW